MNKRAKRMMEYHRQKFMDYARQLEAEEELRLATEYEIRVNLGNIVHWGAYLQGAMEGIAKMIEELDAGKGIKGEKGVYDRAVLKLILRDKRSMGMWLTHSHDILFRNHQRDKKGKLLSVEASFAEKVCVYREV